MSAKKPTLILPLIVLAALCLGASGMPAVIAAEPEATPPIAACKNGAFSTEEDFIARDIKPFDGNMYISDGDVLS